MKRTAHIQKIVIVALTLGFVSLASTSFACWGNWMGHGPGNAYTNLTAEQQQQLDTVKTKYSGQLDELQASLNSKSNEYRTARANDSTTVGSLKQLETEIADLEQQYWTLLDKANTEAGGFIAGGKGSWFHCGYNGCDHQSHWGQMGQGRHMGSGQHMGTGHMTRMAGHRGDCWRN